MRGIRTPEVAKRWRVGGLLVAVPLVAGCATAPPNPTRDTTPRA